MISQLIHRLSLKISQLWDFLKTRAIAYFVLPWEAQSGLTRSLIINAGPRAYLVACSLRDIFLKKYTRSLTGEVRHYLGIRWDILSSSEKILKPFLDFYQYSSQEAICLYEPMLVLYKLSPQTLEKYLPYLIRRHDIAFSVSLSIKTLYEVHADLLDKHFPLLINKTTHILSLALGIKIMHINNPSLVSTYHSLIYNHEEYAQEIAQALVTFYRYDKSGATTDKYLRALQHPRTKSYAAADKIAQAIVSLLQKEITPTDSHITLLQESELADIASTASALITLTESQTIPELSQHFFDTVSSVDFNKNAHHYAETVEILESQGLGCSQTYQKIRQMPKNIATLNSCLKILLKE